MNHWTATVFVALFFQFGVFGEIEKRQSCTLQSITSFVNGLGADCLSRLADLGALNVEVAMSGTITTSRLDAVADRVCTTMCGKRVVEFSRNNNCGSINLPQNLNLEALCSKNGNRRCLQILDEVPGPSTFTTNCTSLTSCSSGCMTEANNYKSRLGCCFGTLKGSLTSVTTTRIDNCNVEPGESCTLMYSGGIIARSINWMFALIAAGLTFAVAFN